VRGRPVCVCSGVGGKITQHGGFRHIVQGFKQQVG
jgi:hypothetical protein